MPTTPVQEAPPGAFLPDLAVIEAASTICPHRCGPCVPCQSVAVGVLTAGLTAIDPTLLDTHHVLIIGEDRWTLQHPLACRPNLAGCPMHAEVNAELRDNDRLLNVGSYRVETRDGELLIDGAPLHDDPEHEDDPE